MTHMALDADEVIEALDGLTAASLHWSDYGHDGQAEAADQMFDRLTERFTQTFGMTPREWLAVHPQPTVHPKHP